MKTQKISKRSPYSSIIPSVFFLYILITSLMVSPTSSTIAGSFAIFKSKIENVIKLLANNVTQILANMCTEEQAACLDKSYNQCQGTSQSFCIDDYPKLDQCFTMGAKISNRSGSRLPNNINVSMLTDYERLAICATTKMDESMRKVKIDNTNNIDRIYFGLQSKFFRAFPGVQQNNLNDICINSYDPTQRLWYVGAVTGSKKIVLMIDISTAMTSDMLNSIKKAAIALINTLGLNDFVGVVLYSNSAKIQMYQSLKRATLQIKTALKSIITSIGLSSSLDSNYELAFSKAKELFSNNMTDVYGAPCSLSTNIVLLLAASAPTVGKTQVADLIASVDEWGVSNRIKMFTYGFGNSTDSNLLKSLACKYEGSMFQVSDLSMTSTLIRQYESWLTRTINIDSPIWSQPYNDATTGKRIVTISLPIYVYVNGARKIIGAFSIDVSMNLLSQQYNIPEDEILTKVMTCTPIEPVLFPPCLIQNLRPASSKCNLQNCSIVNNSPVCNLTVTTDVFATGQNSTPQNQVQIYDCCSLKVTQAKIVIPTAISSGLIGFLLIGVFFYRRYHKRLQKQFEKTDENKTNTENENFIGIQNIQQITSTKQIRNRKINNAGSVSSQYQSSEPKSSKKQQMSDKKQNKPINYNQIKLQAEDS